MTGGANRHTEPGEIAVEIPRLFYHGTGRIRLHNRCPGGNLASGDNRLPEIEHVGAADAAQLAPTAELMEPIEGQ